MRCISLLIMVCALLVITGVGQESKIDPAHQGQVEQSQVTRIADPEGKRDGVSTLLFPPNTLLADTPFPPIVSYEGEWRAGLAEGQGLLHFPPTPTGPIVNESAGKPNYYQGLFSNGRPTGEGTFVYNFYYGPVMKISGLVSGREIVISLDGQDLVVITPLGGKNGEDFIQLGKPLGSKNSKGLVRLMQYPHNKSLMPSRVFFGEFADGVITGGEWVDVPWYENDDRGTRAGYGRYAEGSLADNSSYSCEFEPRRPDAPTLTQTLLGATGPMTQLWAGTDYLYRSKAVCTATTNEGWSFTSSFEYPDKHTLLGCKAPDGKAGRLSGDTCNYKKKKKRRHDVFTNIGREFKRFVDRRVLGTLDKAGGSVEKAMCRATGTEPGKNCNVSMSVSAIWPVGDEPANNLHAEDEAARQRFIAASKRASRIPDAHGQTAFGEATGMTAELLAVCNALCVSGSQQRYSEALLSELERVAKLPADESSIRTIASVNRETASVMSAGIRLLTIGATVIPSSIALYSWANSAKQTHRIWTAHQAVEEIPASLSNPKRLEKQLQALAELKALRDAHLNKMGAEGVNLLGQSITSRIRVLRGFPPQRASAVAAAIALRRTAKQVEEFVEKYKDVKSEDELYDAIIAEVVTPLGIKWPPEGR